MSNSKDIRTVDPEGKIAPLDEGTDSKDPFDTKPWRTLRRHIKDWDEKKIKDVKEDIDTLLVFAGLFSAVLTAFIIELYKQLQPDPDNATVLLLIAIAGQLNRTLVDPKLVGSFQPSTVFPPSSGRVINGLWFTGLYLSLVTASVGMLAKQWLREFLAVEDPSIDFFRRHRGLTIYGVYGITAFLPMLLQLALILFLIGLFTFLNSLDVAIGRAVEILVLGWLVMYAATLFTPLFHYACPYRTPMIAQVQRVIMRVLIDLPLRGLRNTLSSNSPDDPERLSVSDRRQKDAKMHLKRSIGKEMLHFAYKELTTIDQGALKSAILQCLPEVAESREDVVTWVGRSGGANHMPIESYFNLLQALISSLHDTTVGNWRPEKDNLVVDMLQGLYTLCASLEEFLRCLREFKACCAHRYGARKPSSGILALMELLDLLEIIYSPHSDLLEHLGDRLRWKLEEDFTLPDHYIHLLASLPGEGLCVIPAEQRNVLQRYCSQLDCKLTSRLSPQLMRYMQRQIFVGISAAEFDAESFGVMLEWMLSVIILQAQESISSGDELGDTGEELVVMWSCIVADAKNHMDELLQFTSRVRMTLKGEVIAALLKLATSNASDNWTLASSPLYLFCLANADPKAISANLHEIQAYFTACARFTHSPREHIIEALTPLDAYMRWYNKQGPGIGMKNRQQSSQRRALPAGAIIHSVGVSKESVLMRIPKSVCQCAISFLRILADTGEQYNIHELIECTQDLIEKIQWLDPEGLNQSASLTSPSSTPNQSDHDGDAPAVEETVSRARPRAITECPSSDLSESHTPIPYINKHSGTTSPSPIQYPSNKRFDGHASSDEVASQLKSCPSISSQLDLSASLEIDTSVSPNSPSQVVANSESAISEPQSPCQRPMEDAPPGEDNPFRLNDRGSMKSQPDSEPSTQPKSDTSNSQIGLDIGSKLAASLSSAGSVHEEDTHTGDSEGTVSGSHWPNRCSAVGTSSTPDADTSDSQLIASKSEATAPPL